MKHQGFRVKLIAPDGTEYQRNSWQVRSTKGVKDQKKITFEFNFSSQPTPNRGVVSIENVKNSDIQKFKKEKKVQLEMGWLPSGQNQPLVIEGLIDDVKPYDMQKRTKWAIDIFFHDVPATFFNKHVSDDWGPGTQAEEVFKSLVYDKLGIEFKTLRPKRQFQYHRGKTIYKPLRQALRNVARDLHSKYFIYNNKAHIMSSKDFVNKTAILNTQKGNLLNRQPATGSEGYNITGLFSTKIVPMGKAQVQSNDVNQTLRVLKGRHYSDKAGKKFRTEFTGVPL